MILGAVSICSTALLVSSVVILNQEHLKKEKISMISRKISITSNDTEKEKKGINKINGTKEILTEDDKVISKDRSKNGSKNAGVALQKDSKEKKDSKEQKNKKEAIESKSNGAENKTRGNDLIFTKTPVKEDKSYSDVERPTLEDIINAPTKINRNSYFGSIDIDDLGIHTNTFKNLDKDTNKISMMQGTLLGLKNQTLGKGNYVLYGHNLGYTNVLFSDLPKAEKGMIIMVTEQKVTKNFKVVDVKTVKNTDTRAFNMSKEPKLTLITCDIPKATDLRVIVTAELVK